MRTNKILEDSDLLEEQRQSRKNICKDITCYIVLTASVVCAVGLIITIISIFG